MSGAATADTALVALSELRTAVMGADHEPSQGATLHKSLEAIRVLEDYLVALARLDDFSSKALNAKCDRAEAALREVVGFIDEGENDRAYASALDALSAGSGGHHEDYSRPLDVRWLCPFCHSALHRARNGTTP